MKKINLDDIDWKKTWKDFFEKIDAKEEEIKLKRIENLRKSKEKRLTSGQKEVLDSIINRGIEKYVLAYQNGEILPFWLKQKVFEYLETKRLKRKE